MSVVTKILKGVLAAAIIGVMAYILLATNGILNF
jgi:hypothetical protein